MNVSQRSYSILVLGGFSNRTGTSVDKGKRARKGPNATSGAQFAALPFGQLVNWSSQLQSQLFDLRTPSWTDVPVLLLCKSAYYVPLEGTVSCRPRRKLWTRPARPERVLRNEYLFTIPFIIFFFRLGSLESSVTCISSFSLPSVESFSSSSSSSLSSSSTGWLSSGWVLSELFKSPVEQ